MTTKKDKKAIPQPIRIGLWEQEIGDKLWDSCFCCGMRMNAFEFQAGHIISESNGGSLKLDNLKVICKPCNGKMGTTNLLDFKAQRWPNKKQYGSNYFF